jgi:hypothetical protein
MRQVMAFALTAAHRQAPLKREKKKNLLIDANNQL